MSNIVIKNPKIVIDGESPDNSLLAVSVHGYLDKNEISTLLGNLDNVSIENLYSNSNKDQNSDVHHDIELEFNATSMHTPQITKMANELLKKYNDRFQQLNQ